MTDDGMDFNAVLRAQLSGRAYRQAELAHRLGIGDDPASLLDGRPINEDTIGALMAEFADDLDTASLPQDDQ